MTELRGIAEAEGGVIVNVAGDGFFAIFGVPAALADPAHRAVRASAKMRTAIAERNANSPIHVPDVHTGVAAGEVLVTPSPDPLGWAVVGSAINLASRLCDAATADTVLVDGEVHRLLGAEGEWRTSLELTVQGHSGRVTAWELAGAPSPATALAPDAVFVGREDLLARLDAEWTAARSAGCSRLVTLSGPAGIGKSRLLHAWVSTHPASTRCIWVTGGVSGSEAALLDLARSIQDGAGSTDARFLPEGHLSTVNRFGDGAAKSLIAAVRRAIKIAAEPDGIVLIIDDLDRAEPDLVAFVRHVLAEPIDSPVLTVASFRDEEAPPLPVDIELAALTESQTGSLISAALGAPTPSWVEAMLIDRVQGHPLMVLQTAAYLREAGIVTVKDGQCSVHDRTAIDQLPASVRLFISARIDRLPSNEKIALHRMSALGDEWTADWAVKALGARSATAIESLSRRGLIETRDAHTWRFSHALVRDVAYSSLTRRDRADLHRRQLDLLGGSSPASLRAFHAVRWSESVPMHERGPFAVAAKAAVSESLAHARTLTWVGARSVHDVVRQVANAVDEIAEGEPGLTAEILTLDAQSLIELGRFDDALQAAARAQELGNRDGVPAFIRARCLLAKGDALSRLRRYQSARQTLDEAVVLAEAANDGSAKAHGLRLMADTWRHSLMGRYVSLTEEAYDAFVACGDTEGGAACARTLAYLHSIDPPALHDRWYQLAAAATDKSDVVGQGSLARSRAGALLIRYDYRGAKRESQLALDLADQSGEADVLGEALTLHILSLLGNGAPDRAAADLERLRGFTEALANPRMSLVAAAVSAHVYLRTQGHDRAVEELQFARARLADFGPSEERSVVQAEALVARDRGDWRASISGFARSAALATEAGFRVPALGDEIEILRGEAALGAPTPPDRFASLSATCAETGLPLMASFVGALSDLAHLNVGQKIQLSRAHPEACTEEIATRADCAALLAEADGVRVESLWDQSRRLWARLGNTVWLARAQARSGDVDAARHTLDLLDSPAEARAWALAVGDT